MNKPNLQSAQKELDAASKAFNEALGAKTDIEIKLAALWRVQLAQATYLEARGEPYTAEEILTMANKYRYSGLGDAAENPEKYARDKHF